MIASTEEVDELARKIRDYHLMHQELKKADAILVLGSYDIRVAERGIDLLKQGYAPYIIFSGGYGVQTKKLFDKPEADVFADVARKRDVPEERIIIENKSTNTGENIEFTKRLLAERGLDFKSFILVQKPYMERRTYATFMKRWPEKELVVTSPQIPFEDYPTETLPKELIINIMVGDLQRIKEYPAKGFQIAQDIPDDVWKAYERLVELGYTKHLIKEK